MPRVSIVISACSKVFELLLPTWYVRHRLAKAFGFDVPPVSESAAVRIVVDFLPYVIFVILSQRIASDRRPVKYFLPYGRVRQYVEGTYGVGHVRYKDVPGWVGHFRNWLPYGLVQWWDFDDDQVLLAQRLIAEKRAKRAEFADWIALARRRLAEMPSADRPLVSVVVPAYNVENYLRRCLDSLIAQTFEPIEIIVVDDGSTDGTSAICDEYAVRDPRVRVIHRENGGRSAARNSGMDVACGKYIGFVDGDDYVDAEMFETMAASLEMDEEADFARCGVKVEFQYEVSGDYRRWVQTYFKFDFMGSVPITPELACLVDNSVCNKLYRRQTLTMNGIRFPEGFDNEDVVFSFFTLGKSSRMVALDMPFYRYVRNDRGIMARQVAEFSATRVLPDSLTKVMPLVAEYLLADDRRDLLGAFFRRLCGAANGFKGDAAAKRVAQLLARTDYFYNRELLDRRDLGWVRNQLSTLANYDWSDLAPIEVDPAFLPVLRPRFVRLENPLVSVVIPVYNQELYLNFCLESVRKQTFAEFEIICIDDGSSDHSRALLEKLAAIDGRMRVVHQENEGAAATRNRGIREAKGKYIVFIDADDFVERTYLAEVVNRMEHDALDMCIIDLDCFDYRTRNRFDHYWSICNQRSFYPDQPVFTFSDMKRFCCMVGPVSSVWRREFLQHHDIHFPSLRNGEDTIFWMQSFPLAKRVGMIPKVFYHYRRGNPNSAVSSLHSARGASNALMMIRGCLGQWERMLPRLSFHEQALIAGRLSAEISYYARLAKDVLPYMRQEGFERFGLHRIADVADFSPNWPAYEKLMREFAPVSAATDPSPDAYRAGFPSRVRRLVERIERERETSVKDLYLITGQLNSTSNAPIDSWTFFKYLQKKGVPSRYVIWRKHEWYPRLKRENELKDVIVLDGSGVDDYEFLFKCHDALVRCKVFGQENGVLNWRIRKWAYCLPGCLYAYIEHGIKYWKYTDRLGTFLSSFNAINNSSAYEAGLLAADIPTCADSGAKPNCFVGGLARFDTFRDERDPSRKEFTLFVMFTWRATFNAGQSALEKSAYYHGLRTLFSPDNLRLLARAGIRVKISAHHHLVNHIRDLNFGGGLEIVSQTDVAYWKAHADCCLTDYSSIAFDFLFLDKPAVFWTPDRTDALLVESDYNELVMVEKRAQGMINVCDSAASVISLLVKYAERRFELEPEKKSAVAKFFDHRTDLCGHLHAALESAAMNA